MMHQCECHCFVEICHLASRLPRHQHVRHICTVRFHVKFLLPEIPLDMSQDCSRWSSLHVVLRLPQSPRLPSFHQLERVFVLVCLLDRLKDLGSLSSVYSNLSLLFWKNLHQSVRDLGFLPSCPWHCSKQHHLRMDSRVSLAASSDERSEPCGESAGVGACSSNKFPQIWTD